MVGEADIRRIAALLLVVLLTLVALLVLLVITGIVAEPETVIEQLCRLLFGQL